MADKHKFILQLGVLSVDTGQPGLRGYMNTIEQKEDKLPGNTAEYIDIIGTDANKARASNLLYYHVGKVNRTYFDVLYPDVNIIYFIPKDMMFLHYIHQITKEELK